MGLRKLLDLDIILAQKYELFKSFRINKPHSVDELPLKFSFECHDICCLKLSHESHLFLDMIYSKTIDITKMTKGLMVQYLDGFFKYQLRW